MAIIRDANIPTTGIGGPSPSPDYAPPSIIWKDADEIYVPKGRYYKAGYRFGGQYQDLSNLSDYWDVADRFAVDVDATYSAGSTSGMVGGDMLSSWYSVFMVDSDEIMLLPFLRVDTISYSAPSTTITTAAHGDGTTESNGWVSAADCFNGYRLVLINDDTTESGNVYTIADTGTSPVDNVTITGDVTADVAATEWLQMIPPDGTPCLYLGSLYFKSDGNLRWFKKTKWQTEFNPYVELTGTSHADTPGNTDLGAAVPPTSEYFNAWVYPGGNSCTRVQGMLYKGSSGTDIQRIVSARDDSTNTYHLMLISMDIPITSVGIIRTLFQQWTGSAWAACTNGLLRVQSYTE